MRYPFILVRNALITTGLLLFFSGCSNSDSSTSTQSFLEGGTYGSFSAKTIEGNRTTETMPFFGIVNPMNITTQGLDIRQFFFPYGGIKSSYGEDYNKYGNSDTYANTMLKIKLYPNTLQIHEGTEVKMFILSDKDGYLSCITNNSDGELALKQLMNITPESLSSCVNASYMVNSDTALDIELDLGEFTASSSYRFEILWQIGDALGFVRKNGVDYTNNSNAAFVGLNVTDTTPSTLPVNTYSSGSFLPTPNGFGFVNYGDDAYNLFTKEDIAEGFGKESVCFVDNDTCVALNPFGYFLKLKHETIYSGANGLCYGYAMASMMLKKNAYFDGKKFISDYNPLAQNAVELNYNDVKHLIASQYINQYSTSAKGYISNTCSTFRPTDVIDIIENGFSTFNPIAAITVFNAQGNGGHAVTPYAMSDEGDNMKRIYVYDNNYPGDTSRYIEVNTTSGAEHWYYYTGLNAGSPGLVFEGAELNNTMCPIPLSIYSERDIGVQEIDSTRFIDLSKVNAQVVDANDRISGADFDTLTEINNIPNATLSEIAGSSNELTIADLADTNDLEDINATNFQNYLSSMYTVNAKFAFTDANQSLEMIQSSILDSNITTAYYLKTGEIADINLSTMYTFKADATSRIVTFEDFTTSKSGSLEMQYFLTMNSLGKGYIHQIIVKEDDLTQNSVGFFVKNSGSEIIVFEYDADTNASFNVLDANISTQELDANGSVKQL